MTDANQLITEHLDVWTSAIEKKSSAGRGNGGGVSLYGITKLRELVLDLAVRGKLVSQCDEEGTGGDLKDAVLKSRMAAVRSKVLRKQKLLPEITDQEVLFAIPPSWAVIRLGELTNYGVTDKAEADEVNDDIWVLELEDVEKVSSKLLKRVYFSERRFKSSKNRFQAGDVIYGKLRPYLDKVLVADEAGVCTTEMIPMRAFGGVSPDFVRVFLKSPEFIRYADDSTHGMNLPRLGTERARMAVVPLPPLAEQGRIVAKVDELMALCDELERQAEDSLEAHQTLVETCLATLTNSQSPEELTQNWTRIEAHFDTLFTTEESISKLEETIIQLGITGRLGTQNKADEPAHMIIDEIKRREGKSKKSKTAKLRGQISVNRSDEVGFQLPKGWEIVEFADLIEPDKPIAYGVLVPGKDTNGGVPFVRIADLSINEPAELPEKSILPKVDQQYARTRLDGGEILMGVVGSIGKLGVAPASWKGANIARAVCRIVPATELSKEYVLLLLRSDLMQRGFRGDTRVLAQPTLNIGLIRAAPTPVPPVAEQLRIVKRVEDLLKYCALLRSKAQLSSKLAVQIADTLTSKIH